MLFRKGLIAFTLFAFSLFFTGQARAASVLINFSTEPALALQPNNFFTAGAAQTYSSSGLYSISGGVALGNPTFLASFPAQGSAPNLYGTADFADASLLGSITLNFPALAGVSQVSGVLFNGQPFAEDYTVQANGTATVSFTGVQSDSSVSGFRSFSFSGIGTITSLTITSPNTATNGWDFLVDNIQLTTSSTSVPEPSTLSMALCGLVALSAFRRRFGSKIGQDT